ncbi:glycosyltransferase family 4 protein [Paenibacillus macerans]|uniref:glycosyltransferase family 4 protein n=1 Tax=Paenibacillus macerans TaxID=44252 RepID=UPI003D30F5F6
MEREKVAVISPGAFAAPPGKSRSAERVIEQMIPPASERLHIRIFGMADGHLPSQGWIGNVPCYRLPGGRLYLESLLRHLRKWRPETVDVHNRPLLACQLKGRLPLARVLLSLHSASLFAPSCHPKTCTLRMLETLDGLIVNSEFVRQELLAQFPQLHTPVWVNPPGVSPEEFIPRWTAEGEERRRVRLAELGWERRKIVLWIGRLTLTNGVRHLLGAFPGVLAREPEAMLVIVGSPYSGVLRDMELERELKTLAADFGDRVALVPYTPYLKAADWYILADCAAVTADDEAAFGLGMIEAMASAVPVVVAGSGAVPGSIADDYTGYPLIAEGPEDRLADRIVRLLEEKELRQAIGLAGRELACSRFRWEHAADRWADMMRAGSAELPDRRRVKN